MNREEEETLNFFQILLGGPKPTVCRHGESKPHIYGMGDEPDYDGGEILDVAWYCDGP